MSDDAIFILLSSDGQGFMVILSIGIRVEELDRYSLLIGKQAMIVTPNSIIQSTRRSGEA
jgi:hypothetical protein